jgi:hypothetical protein
VRREILSLPGSLREHRRRREHVPTGSPPHYILQRRGDEWGLVIIHEGRELHWYKLTEARRMAGRVIELANIGAKPGELPIEEIG